MPLFFRSYLIGISLRSLIPFLFFTQALAYEVSFEKQLETHKAEKNWAALVELLNPRLQELDRKQLELLAQSYTQLDSHLQSVRVYQVLVNRFSGDESLRLALASAQSAAGEDRAAIQTLKEIIKLNSKFEPAYVELAALIQRRQPRNLFEIRSTYEDLIRAVGPKPDYLVKLCDLTTREGQHSLASRYCQQALKEKPGEVSSYINLIIVQFQTGRDAAAHENLLRTKKRFPESLELWRYAGSVYAADKNYLMAYQAFKKAFEIDESHAEIRLELAKAALQLNLYEESHRHFLRACQSDRSIRVEVRRAAAFLRQSRVEEWTERFEALAGQCGQASLQIQK